MKQGNTFWRSIWLAILLLATVGLTACDENNDEDGTDIRTTTVCYGSQVTIHTVRFDWSPDGQWIAFEGIDNTNPNIYRVSAQAGSTPVRISNYDPVSTNDGGETPNYLTDGTIGFYVGWIFAEPPEVNDDKDMHIMAATSTQVDNSPASTVLRRFNSSDLGGAANSASSPDALSLSGDGTKATISWGSTTYTLDWSGATVSAVKIAVEASDAAISKDGSKIAYVNVSGEVVIRAFSGGATTAVGTGASPSWTLDGRLGYAGNGGYVVYTPGTGQSKTYPTSIYLQNAAISRDGKKIAYRTFGGPNTGVSIGILEN